MSILPSELSGCAVRSEQRGLGALLAALMLGGCSYGWDALRPGPDGGVVGQTDIGTPRDVGTDRGAALDAATDGAMADATTEGDVGVDASVDVVVAMDVPVAIDLGPMDVGMPDTGPRDTGVADVGIPDTGPRDMGVVDVGVPDTGPPPCTGPTCACSPTAPMGWCAIGGTCTAGACEPGTIVGALVITEIMNDPSAVTDQLGEWFEVYNRSETPVDLRGMRVRGSGTEVFDIGGSMPVLVAGRGYAVFASTGDMLINGGVTVTYPYGSAIALGNTGTDFVMLLGSDGATIIDSVTYGTTVASGWPITSGRAKALRPPTLDAVTNDAATAWCSAATVYGSGDFGTPGAANVCP